MLYFIQAEGVGHIKIGFTDGEAESRLAMLQTGSPVPLRLLGTLPGTMEDEKNLHRRFASACVVGEWFKPVPELVELIGKAEGRKCGSVEVIERSVQVRILTVGRKQFSRALLDQLPVEEAVDWYNVLSEVRDQMPQREVKKARDHAAGIELAQYVSGDVWGWVVGGFRDPSEARGNDHEWPYRWIVFARGGRLYKHRDYRPWASMCWFDPEQDEGRYAVETELAKWLYPRRKELTGWRDEDQLFFGV